MTTRTAFVLLIAPVSRARALRSPWGQTISRQLDIGNLACLRQPKRRRYRDLDITDCTFTGGESRGAVDNCGGGAIFIEGPSGLTATIVDCTFTSNLSVFTANNTGAGGAIYMSGSGPNSITGCTFTTNEAAGTGGGAIYYDCGSLTITDCTFDSNDASGGDGGGMYSTGDSPLEIVACTFDSNTADGNGGGLYFHGAAGDPLLTDDPGETDLDGHARVLCELIDMGPYEFGIGDYDCDQTVDLDDYAFFTQCLTGPNGGPPEPGCEPFDFNADGAIDLRDAAGFQRAFMEFTP